MTGKMHIYQGCMFLLYGPGNDILQCPRVPVSYVDNAGDPYKDQMEECIYLIMQTLKDRGVGNDHTLAYQPYTDEVLVELGQRGVKSLLAIPVSFVSEQIETLLEEIDMEYWELALESGIQNWGRVPALS
ncbi:hypothetical protein Patl1_24299 [Pistacia atlantica]|uniref:Uncharacterized protein n=1 Tax=Pistacia atlantica TaxID=434234 RepID=A0ACC0ZY38_9ROSI|nr:hypothetical protein Patl1_24299 [Pistacia atlantica]